MIADLLAFALAATLLILAPGPDSLLVMRNTVRDGRRAGLVTACGTLSGLAVWAVAAAFGLAALVRASSVGYDVLRFAGAAYLIWLGLSSLGVARRRRPGRALGLDPDRGASADAGLDLGPGASAGRPRATPRAPRLAPASPVSGSARAYLNGLVANLFNPKVGVFFVAFLPGFIPAGAPAPLYPLELGLWFIAETGAWLATLAWLSARGVSWLRRPAVARRLERLTGVVLIGFGVRLAAQSR